MDKKIGIIANSVELKNTIINLYEKDFKNGRILIDLLDSDKINEQGYELEKKGAKAIIARSGGYRHTLGKVSVPVIQLRMYIQDILYSIMIAKKTNKKIVTILSDIDYFNYTEWKDLIQAEIITETFYDIDEIESVVMKYAHNQSKYIIVGGGIPCKYAEKYNIDYVNIIASDETIHDIISRAREMIDNLYEQKYNNSMLENILGHVHDSIITINNEEKIIIYNERAEELLKKEKNTVIGKLLIDIFPEFSFMLDVLYNKKNKYNEIIQFKKIVMTANISLIEMDGEINGVLCTFQDITKLQSMEKKIRFELNKKGMTAKYNFSNLIAKDQIMKVTIAKAVQIGMSDSTALLYGESGTGKEMLAQSIHNISKRKDDPFVAVNCAALTESLLESELFGYEEGAFTGARKGGKPGLFELAHGGTLFLDEINSMPINLQTKLLRVLEEKEVMRIGSDYVIPLDVRILAAANENLKVKINNGSFRSDLFYRLSILELYIPPLRKRKLDIMPLFKNFISIFSKTSNIQEIDSELEYKLLNYSWPGNVRELRNVAERYILFGELDITDNDEMIFSYNKDDNTESNNKLNNNIGDFTLDLKEIDRYVELKVIDMLEKQGMSKNNIAKMLGISRSSLWNKINSNNKNTSKK